MLARFADGSLESLSTLHAVEHFGLGRYGDPIHPDGWRRAAEALARVLAPGGRLYFSVPIGRERLVFNAHRVFSPERCLRASLHCGSCPFRRSTMRAISCPKPISTASTRRTSRAGSSSSPSEGCQRRRRPAFSPHLTLAPALRTVTEMLPRLAAGALVAIGFVFAHGEGAALADDPPQAPVPSQAPAPAALAGPAPPASAPQAQPHGAVVVATADGTGSAARALAFDVYRDADLRPSIDDATARVLAGDAPAEGAPARLKEIAELRGSIAHADPSWSRAGCSRPWAPSSARRSSFRWASMATARWCACFNRRRPRSSASRSRPPWRSRPTAPGRSVGPAPRRLCAASYLFPIRLPPPVVPAAVGGVGGSASKPQAALPPAPLAPKVESSAAPAAPAEPRPFYNRPGSGAPPAALRWWG